MYNNKFKMDLENGGRYLEVVVSSSLTVFKISGIHG
jgi:hypothetical protein